MKTEIAFFCKNIQRFLYILVSYTLSLRALGNPVIETVKLHIVCRVIVAAATFE